MFSQTAEYAVRAVVWLAQAADEQRLDASHIAKATHVPASYLSKVLQALTREGLVLSKRGIGGGYRLARPAAAITLLDVVQAVDPIRRIEGCPLGLAAHAIRLCGMHAKLDQAMRVAEETLGSSTIADILETPERPAPMVETIGLPITTTES